MSRDQEFKVFYVCHETLTQKEKEQIKGPFIASSVLTFSVN